MSVAVIVVCSLAVWFALGTPAALILGRAIRLADQRAVPLIPPAVDVVGEEPARRRGHLHAV